MNRKRIIVVNFIVFAAIIIFVFGYAHAYRRTFIEEQTKSFEDQTIAVEQITENYLVNEQRICDVWAQYIVGQGMTMGQAIDYLRKSAVLTETSCQVLYMDEDYPYGLSTHINVNTGSNEVKYDRIQLFTGEMQPREIGAGVNITRAFTDPVSGVQSLAFYNWITIWKGGVQRSALILRILPISDLQQRWKFQTEKFDTVEYAIVDKDGNYIIKGSTFKNKNFFEFYRSYNEASSAQLTDLKTQMAEGTGTFQMVDSRKIPVLVCYTPVESTEDWKIVSGVQYAEISRTTFRWGLLLFVALGLTAIFLYDLAAIQLLNKRLQAAAQDAERANHAKTDFLSTMSHDIRTPMNAIVGMTEIARSNVNDPAKLTECLDKITLANHHLLTLINDILDISKIESGKVELANTEFSLRDLWENMINVSEPQAERKKIRFTVRENFRQDRLVGDSLRLNQIYINLLSNAIKYTGEGGEVTAFLEEQKSPKGADYTRLVWEVKDNGVGMSEEFMQHMYSAFSRAVDTRVNKVEGTGLGLAIVKQLVDLMGGTIACESALNQGTRFVVTLDLQKGTETRTNQTQGVEETVDIAGMKVLVAEDIEVNWEIISTMLAAAEIETSHAWDGEECVRMVQEAEPHTWDLILMDIQMPKMNGLDATRAIRALPDAGQAGIPIIAMTADAFSENVKQSYEAGMNGHIAKPIDMKLVLKAIRKIKEEQNT